VAQHIGVVAVSGEGAALCYRTICAEGPGLLGRHAHPEVTVHGHPLADYMRAIAAGDWDEVGELMLSSARRLAAAGAEVLICPDSTTHRALPGIIARSPAPWVHIADAVVAEAQERGYRRVGLMGTRWLVDSDVYPARLEAVGIAHVRPARSECDELTRIVLDELVSQIVRPESVIWLQRLIATLAGAGCDAVVLGCAELPLVLDDSVSSLPVLDSTRLLARAALRRVRRRRAKGAAPRAHSMQEAR